MITRIEQNAFFDCSNLRRIINGFPEGLVPFGTIGFFLVVIFPPWWNHNRTKAFKESTCVAFVNAFFVHQSLFGVAAAESTKNPRSNSLGDSSLEEFRMASINPRNRGRSFLKIAACVRLIFRKIIHLNWIRSILLVVALWQPVTIRSSSASIFAHRRKHFLCLFFVIHNQGLSVIFSNFDKRIIDDHREKTSKKKKNRKTMMTNDDDDD